MQFVRNLCHSVANMMPDLLDFLLEKGPKTMCSENCNWWPVTWLIFRLPLLCQRRRQKSGSTSGTPITGDIICLILSPASIPSGTFSFPFIPTIYRPRDTQIL
jgi:hypothetical protein